MMRSGNHERSAMNLVTKTMIQRFMINQNIILRRQTGKLQLLAEEKLKEVYPSHWAEF